MASPTATPAPPPSPEVVGNEFIRQYYTILQRRPDIVHKFYYESSTVSRPDSSGAMTSVTTIEAINDKILSMDFKDCELNILTADSQPSYKQGVVVLVTGFLTGMDNIPRKFTQSFFLAPQEVGGYFVLNDVFRFLDQNQPDGDEQILVGTTTNDGPTDSEPVLVQDSPVPDTATTSSEGKPDSVEEAYIPPENGNLIVQDKNIADPPAQPHVASEIKTTVQDVPKRSYALVVKEMKGSTSNKHVPATRSRTGPTNTEKPLMRSKARISTPEDIATKKNTISESSNSRNCRKAVEGHSVYVGNLPLNATARQVEKEFKKFGPVKPGGVQVRFHKFDYFCFGFVEFESLEAMKAAIEASTVMIGGYQAFIKEKRTKTKAINGGVMNGNGDGGRGYHPTRRGGYWNDGWRGRFNVNQGYRKKGDHSGHV